MKITKRRFTLVALLLVLVIALIFITKKLLKPSLNTYPAIEKQDEGLNLGLNCFYDFETTEDIPCKVFDKNAHSGRSCLRLDENTEYSVAFVKSVSELSEANLVKMGISAWLYPLQENPNIVLVLSIESKTGSSILWKGKGTEGTYFKPNEWRKLNAVFSIPENERKKIDKDALIKVYIWNKARGQFMADDIEVVYGEPKERAGEKPSIVMDYTKDSTYLPAKNTPPYPVKYFAKFETKHELEKINFLEKNKLFVGDFNSDNGGLEELAVVNSREVKMFGYDGKTNIFKMVWSSAEKREVDDWNFRPPSKTKFLINKNYKAFFKPTDSIFPGNFDRDDEQEFLVYNRDWRFDLKEAEIVNNAMVIKNTIDFVEYSEDHNPKYYEYTVMIAGNFIEPQSTSLIVVSCNCEDLDYNGKQCKELEQNKSLPNDIAIYQPVND